MENKDNIKLKTSLYDQHVNLNAKMVDFANYLMPINYDKGIKYEYDRVRGDVGIFDVSHMGIFKICGVIILLIISCKHINNKDIRNIKLTTWILFNPDVHKTINSLSFSNFKIVIIEVIKKANGIIFVAIFGIVRVEYSR